MPGSTSETPECPNCAEPVQRTAVMCRFCGCGLSAAHFKKCPFCAEVVRKSALKCRFCQSDLSEPPSGSGEPPEGSPVPKVPLKPRRSASDSLPIPTITEQMDEPRAKWPRNKQKGA